ncbi:MAG: NADP-dependent oxidoreductase [Solirubrobacteraceae bacterium]
MSDVNRKIVLAQRPTGNVDERTVRVEHEPAPEPGPGQALVRTRYLSIDPTIRTWMDDVPGYLPPIGLGEVVRSAGVGEVVQSNSDRYDVGDLVFGLTGWQDYTLADGGAAALQKLPPGIDPTAALSVFGTTGMTAYFGLIDVGRVGEGDTVVVSGAAGATGSIVGQIARIKGAKRVVGIAGSDEKCAWLADELGFDDVINYRTDDVAARLRETCPGGIDLYFDNVGGELLDICLARLALRGRIVLCGAIASYNSREQAVGPRNYRNLIPMRGRMEGFIILDYLDRFAEAQAEMAGWVAAGKVKFAVHLVEGLERAPEALNLLFTGGNTGKVIVKV